MKKSNIDVLEWIYHRMVSKHNENENIDYMVKFKSIIEKLKPSCEHRRTFTGYDGRVYCNLCNEEVEL